MLYGISPRLLPKPADWPDNAWMCGQWVRPVREWDAPRSLQNFLSAGDAPIYVGFGSMVGFHQRALLDAAIGAVGGQRALFYPGWSSADSLQLPPNFCVIGDTRTTGCSPARPWSFITAGLGLRILQPVPVCLRSFCLSQQISSSGPSSYAGEA
jgi:hypothetical protein